jgi:hypothetical protein
LGFYLNARAKEVNMPEPEGKVAFYGPWIGEFGWELMTWQAWCRSNTRNFEKVYVCSYPDMAPLYQDFATFVPHNYKKRHLDWTDTSNVEVDIPSDTTQMVRPFKTYRVGKQEFIKFGDKSKSILPRNILHARGINKGGKNYPLDRWKEVAGGLGNVAFVGTEEDHFIEHPGYVDLRGIPLDQLMNELANAQCVIGQSSGVMHLAALCGAPLVVWGDQKTYFNESLEKRYKETWNPFNVPVTFIGEEKWNPDPRAILQAHGSLHYEPKFETPDIQEQVANDVQTSKGEKAMGIPVPDDYRQKLMKAVKSKKYLLTVHYMDEKDTLQHFWITRNFPTNEMLPSIDHIRKDMQKGGVKEKKVVHAAVERSGGFIPQEAPPEEGTPVEEESNEQFV